MKKLLNTDIMKKILLISILCFVLLSFRVEAVANRSEIRGLFIHYPTFNNDPDWDLVAQTAQDYNHDSIFLEVMTSYNARYNSSIVQHTNRDHLAELLEAAHSRGIEVHAMMLVLMIWEGYGYDEPYPEDWKVTKCDGTKLNWLDPCHPEARNRIKSLVEEVASNYDIDGFMFDYIRYTTEDTSVSQYCRQQFEADTGITVSNWPNDVCYSGQYRNEFMEWRISSITNLVRDMRSWMVAIKPNLEFSSSTFTILYENGNAYPTYNRRAIGQDPADWIRNGYLDFVAPMGYTNDMDRYAGIVSNNIRYLAGGPEGIVPVIKFMSNDVQPTTPEQLKQKIDICRELGCDGWDIWRYGGPGDNSGMTPDIRNYLDIVDLPETFSIENIRAFPSSNSAIINWNSNKPTTSKVEYNTTNLFNWVSKTDWNYQCSCDFPYWDPEYVPGTVVEDNINVTVHSITLTGLQPDTTYYYRVQSQDDSGIASSKIYSFKTSYGTYPINITGIVTDSETDSPIQGATITCGGSADITDENGGYLVMMPSTGSCDLTATKTNYKVNSLYFQFPSNGIYSKNFSLEPIKVNIGGVLKNKDNEPIQVNIYIYQQGTENLISSDQTDESGDYNLSIPPGIYDVKFDFLNFFIKISSLDILSNLNNVINNVTTYGSDRISFFVDDERTIDNVIEIGSAAPNRILMNGSEILSVSSLQELKSNSWYYSDGSLYLKINPNIKIDCVYECCKNEKNYYDKSCSNIDTQYCLNRNCNSKTECSFDCCINEELYLNKSCPSPKYCSNRICVESSGYWKFNEGSGSTTSDSSGNGNNGIIHGASWETANCHSGSCLRFDGQNDYIEVPASSSLNIDGEITIEAWVYPIEPWNGDYPGVVAKYWPTGYLLGIRNSTSTWGFWLKSNSGSTSVTSDSAITFNQWIHLAAVRDSSNTMRMYINGAEQSNTRVFDQSISSADRYLEIGRWDMRYFNGFIDEVRVYKKALTKEEIGEHVSQ